MFKVSEKIPEKLLDKMIGSASRLKRLTEDKSVYWAEYVRLLDDYCKSMLEYKKNFDFSQASDEQIRQIKLHDRDIYIINNFIKKVPFQFCKGLEDSIKKQNEEAEAE